MSLPQFKKVIILKWTLWLSICLTAPPTLAQGFGTLASQLKITKIEHLEDIAADYTSKQVVVLERQALSDAGALTVGKFSISFNPALESVQIEEAYTEKQDGQKIPVLAEQIHEQKGFLATGTNISWPGLNTLQVTFPNVQKGDKTHVRYRKQTHQTALPQWLSHYDYLVNAFDIESYTIQLTAPQAMPLQVFAQGFTTQEATENGRKIWRMQSRSTSTSDELQMANGLKLFAHWMYSTLPSRQALAHAFGTATRQKMQITPEIQALAEQITQGQQADHDKAKAIAQWIAKEMRYVAVFIGAGGYIPHDLAHIIKNRYGDCKDHTLLMMSLLKAVGIDSAPALINTANADWIPPVAASVYNHVLVYIPSLNLFTDPTAHLIPFGKLPWTDSAKPVVVALASGAQDMRTPAFEAKDNRVQVRAIWRIDAQGNAQADIQVNTVGEAATTMQNQLAQIPTGFSGAAVQRFLQTAGLKGKGFVQYPEVQRQTQTQSMSTQLELPQFLNNPEAVSINPHPMISSLPIYVLNNLGPQLDADRRFDMLCVPLQIEETFELHLPPHAQLLSMPKGLQQNQAGISYRSSYRQEGASILGQRHFERAPSTSGHICTVEELAQRRDALQAIRKDLRSTALYKLP